MRRGAFLFFLVGCGLISGLDDIETGAVPVPGDGAVQQEPPKACPSEGRRCTLLPPIGWEGPLLVYEGDAPPMCPASMSLQRVEAHSGTPQAPHSCSACTCFGPAGSTCKANLKQGGNCADAATKTNAFPAGGGCLHLDNDTNFGIDISFAGGGACDAGVAQPQLEPIAWPAVRGCGAPTLLSDGCLVGQVCAPDPPPGFIGQCISMKGDVPCPDPWSKRIATNEHVDDTRGCAECKCGAVSGVKCTGTAHRTGYFVALCSSNEIDVTVPTTACAAGGDNKGVKLDPPVTSGGSCPPSGGAPTGTVVAKDPVTVCCIP
jgi:hypothetical protein